MARKPKQAKPCSSLPLSNLELAICRALGEPVPGDPAEGAETSLLAGWDVDAKSAAINLVTSLEQTKGGAGAPLQLPSALLPPL